MRKRSTTSPLVKCESTISSMSCASTYVYQTFSGYTTATGPPAQRSRHPALLTRTLPTPARPAALTCALQRSKPAWAWCWCPWLRCKRFHFVRRQGPCATWHCPVCCKSGSPARCPSWTPNRRPSGRSLTRPVVPGTPDAQRPTPQGASPRIFRSTSSRVWIAAPDTQAGSPQSVLLRFARARCNNPLLRVGDWSRPAFCWWRP